MNKAALTTVNKLLEKHNLTSKTISNTISLAKKELDLEKFGKAILRKAKSKWSEEDVNFFRSIGITDQYLNN